MTIEKLNELQAAIPTPELLEKAWVYIKNVSAKGQREWRMSIPVNEYDADMIFGEVCRRLKNSQGLLEALEQLLEAIEREVAPNAFENAQMAIKKAKGIEP